VTKSPRKYARPRPPLSGPSEGTAATEKNREREPIDQSSPSPDPAVINEGAGKPEGIGDWWKALFDHARPRPEEMDALRADMMKWAAENDHGFSRVPLIRRKEVEFKDRADALNAFLRQTAILSDDELGGTPGVLLLADALERIRDEADWWGFQWAPKSWTYFAYCDALAKLWSGSILLSRKLRMAEPFTTCRLIVDGLRNEAPDIVKQQINERIKIRRFFDTLDDFLPRLRAGSAQQLLITMVRFVSVVRKRVGKPGETSTARESRLHATRNALLFEVKPRYIAPAGSGAASLFALGKLIAQAEQLGIRFNDTDRAELQRLASPDEGPPSWPTPRGTIRGGKRSQKRSKRS